MLVWHRYLAFGSSMDYMYEELHVQYPLTIEVCPTTSALSAHSPKLQKAAQMYSCACRCYLDVYVAHASNRSPKLEVPQCRCMGRMAWGRLRWGGTLADTPGDCPAASGRFQVSKTHVDRDLAAASPSQSPWLFSDPA